MNICLTLPSRTAVRSATFFGEEIAAVDGLHTRIFLFDTCGTCIESVNSLRCYSLLRYDPVSNGFVARCDTCGNRVCRDRHRLARQPRLRGPAVRRDDVRRPPLRHV